MVTLDKIRSDMKERFLIDKDLHMVDVRADTIDEALSDASVQLNTKISNLQYEVVERGSDGFLGIGKKPWFLKIYQDPNTITKATVETFGINYGMPIYLEAFDYNAYCTEVLFQYYQP